MFLRTLLAFRWTDRLTEGVNPFFCLALQVAACVMLLSLFTNSRCCFASLYLNAAFACFVLFERRRKRCLLLWETLALLLLSGIVWTVVSVPTVVVGVNAVVVVVAVVNEVLRLNSGVSVRLRQQLLSHLCRFATKLDSCCCLSVFLTCCCFVACQWTFV